MQAVDRLQFAPPSAPGLVRSNALPIPAPALLLPCLTWGVNWHPRDAVTVAPALG